MIRRWPTEAEKEYRREYLADRIITLVLVLLGLVLVGVMFWAFGRAFDYEGRSHEMANREIDDGR